MGERADILPVRCSVCLLGQVIGAAGATEVAISLLAMQSGCRPDASMGVIRNLFEKINRVAKASSLLTALQGVHCKCAQKMAHSVLDSRHVQVPTRGAHIPGA